MKGYIYKIENDINDKLYIGKTLSPIEKRWEEHCKDKDRRKCEKRPLYNAMNKYGIEHFYITQIEECELDVLSSRECYWIEYYNTYKNGYNATRGGDGKQLYDYDLIVEMYDKGMLVKEISQYFNCDSQVVTNALKLSGRDGMKNMAKRYSKPIAAYTLDNQFIAQFDSQSDAARWLIKEHICTSTVVKDVANTVGRVANGERKTAYKMLWRNVE